MTQSSSPATFKRTLLKQLGVNGVSFSKYLSKAAKEDYRAGCLSLTLSTTNIGLLLENKSTERFKESVSC